MSSIVAIVGRPNVGKSTFFNRLIQKRDAIVDSQSGVTRDRHYGYSFWNGKEFTVIDTGGFMLGGEDNFEKEINSQVMIAIEEADIVVFVVDVETGEAFVDETIVRIFSMTKPITTVAAMMLYERGCFQLDHPVARFIPSFEQTQVWRGGALSDVEPQSSRMTVRQLMTHTAGLTYGFMNQNVVDEAYRAQGLDDRRDQTLEDWVDQLADLPLMCQPGSQWNYSVATDVLGRLVEVWSGQTLAAFFEEEIFTPLGMVDTGFYVPEEKQHRFCSMYRPASGAVMGSQSPGANPLKDRDPGLILADRFDSSPYLKPGLFYSGGGGLVSTLADYGRFCQMLMNKGALHDVQLLSPKTVAYMRTNQLPDGADLAAMGQPVWSETNYEGIGFGLGWAVVLLCRVMPALSA